MLDRLALPDAPAVPDLLQPTPTLRIDGEQTKLAIAIAFAGGSSGGLFAAALDRAPVPRSTWKPAAFQSDLFLANFVAQCMRIPADGAQAPASAHLVRLLAQPPADPEIVHFRRAIFAELVASPALRHELERLFSLLGRYRARLEGATALGKLDVNRRQLDILEMVRDVFDRMASGFAGARSGLRNLAAFAERVRASEPFVSLCDLLRYDESLATLSLKVGVGADGRIRGFEIVAVSQNDQNPFVSSAWRRWAAKLELFARGFWFGDGEVMARLIYAVFDGLQDDLVPLVQLLGDLEFYLGGLGFHDMASRAGLAVCLPHIVPADSPRVLEDLFNPLLLAAGARVVPCDIGIDRHDATVLVTGPNSGGKTRLLQSVGLAQILAQSGMFVPARVATVVLGPALVVSLIQETSADQAEGRLGMELVRIRQLFEHLPPGSMVILDELCSGTNPSEGEEIFELVVRTLARLRPQTFITTHFLAFAARLEREHAIEELRFLQVELGLNHEPTYRFAPGVARTSLASQTAARLGVTGEQLMALVDRNLAAAGAARG